MNYERAKGSERGEARREALLQAITADLAANGLADFSLRRAARAAGTTHKVLLYYFDGAESLLEQCVTRLREERLTSALAALAREPDASLGTRIRAVWPSLIAEPLAPALDQAIGLAMADPARYGPLGRAASGYFLPSLTAICPAHWTERRKQEVAEMIFAALRGFLVEWRTTQDAAGVARGLDALARALDREEQADG